MSSQLNIFPFVTKPKNLLKLVEYFDTYEAVFSPPTPIFFGSGNWCGVLDKKHLAQSWAQYESSFNVRGCVVFFLVKEEGRFPSTLALPPGVHLKLWFPSFIFVATFIIQISHLPVFFLICVAHCTGNPHPPDPFLPSVLLFWS